MAAKFEAASKAEENERKAMMEKLKRDKAEVVALMQKDKNEKVEETVVAKEMELQEALTKKARETEALLQSKEEEMRAKYNEKVLYCMLSVLRVQISLTDSNSYLASFPHTSPSSNTCTLYMYLDTWAQSFKARLS